MAYTLSSIADARESDPLTVVESCKRPHGGPLAVAETATGDVVLCAQRERGKLGADGKRDRASGVEKFWKRTSSLRDFRDAITVGLIAV